MYIIAKCKLKFEFLCILHRKEHLPFGFLPQPVKIHYDFLFCWLYWQRITRHSWVLWKRTCRCWDPNPRHLSEEAAVTAIEPLSDLRNWFFGGAKRRLHSFCLKNYASREMNPGLLGEKRERHLCAIPPPRSVNKVFPFSMRSWRIITLSDGLVFEDVCDYPFHIDCGNRKKLRETFSKKSRN